jgi:hypothetical protein
MARRKRFGELKHDPRKVGKSKKFNDGMGRAFMISVFVTRHRESSGSGSYQALACRRVGKGAGRKVAGGERCYHGAGDSPTSASQSALSSLTKNLKRTRRQTVL